MNTSMRLQHRVHSPIRASWRAWFLRSLSFAAVLAWAVHLQWPHASDDAVDRAATVSASSLVHWKDAGHDWLLVVDPNSHELVVYDANDGRPLHRLGAASGTRAIDAIVGEGNVVIATSLRDPRPRVFRLPELEPTTLASW